MKDNFEVGDEVVLRGTVSEASVEWHGKPVVLVSLGGSGACSVRSTLHTGKTRP